ncbi:MAG: nucleoside deaminase [Bacilli bacterium]|nr:nucleoside deaminase [Bacilli bacterium]
MTEKIIETMYKEAVKAYKKGEIPVGALITKNNKIIAKSHNNRQKKHNLLGHAEINCILKAEKRIKDWRLDECEMYVTLSPCSMCEIIIEESRLKKVHFLVKQPNYNEKNSKIVQISDQNNQKEEYEKLLKSFFERLRK